MKAISRKNISKVLAFGCICALLISSLAYFTDRVNTDALTFKADDNAITIRPDDPNVTPEDPDDPDKEIEHIWEVKNPDVTDKPIAPGDHADLSYTLNNDGNSAIDVRETLVLTSTEDMDMTNPEFRLFLDATLNAALGGYDGGAVVVDEDIIDARTIKYTIAPFVLSGAEEAVAGADVKAEREFHFVFDRYATNEFQGDVATIDYLVEVKQHSANGPEGGWAEAISGTLTLGGQTLDVVPAK